MDGVRGKASFAKRLGLSASTYDYYEGSRVPPADVLVSIADLAGVDLYWLLTGRTGPTVAPSLHPVIQRAAKLLSESPDSAAPLAAFIDLLAQIAKFPSKSKESSFGRQSAALADIIAQARSSQNDAVQSAPPASPADNFQAGEHADQTSWIPVLGRSAAGLPHFWASDDEAAGVTMLQELVDRHAGRADRHVSSATAAADGKTGEDAVALITLRQAKQDQGAEFISAGGIKTRYPDAFALRIDGESMAPDIRHGDIVIVSPSVPAADGKAAVVQLHQQIGVTCKLYRRSGKVVHLIPLNERFRPQTYPSEQVEWALRVLARVRGLPSVAGGDGGPSR